MAFFRSFFTVSFFILISRIFGFARDILIAKFIEVSIVSDAFFAAFRLPNFFRRVFAEGAFNSAFVPLFIEKITNNKGKNYEMRFLNNIFSLLLYALLIFVLFFQIFMPLLMKILFPGFFNDPLKSELLIDLSRITIFYLIFISLVSLLSGVLNSVKKFAVPASSPIILNVTLIFSIIIASKFSFNFALALSWGVFLAGILQFAWLMFFTYKSGFLIYPKSPTINNDVKKFFKKLVPGIIGANVMQINLLIDSIFASLYIGALSYLYYADRINQLPLAMIGIAIGIALLPTLSKKIKTGKKEEAIELQNKAILFCLALSIPAAFALNLISVPIIYTLFENGKFGPEQTINVAKALSLFAIGLPAYVLVKVLEPAFFARSNTKTPMKIAIYCLISNVFFNLIFFSIKFGFLGIVISSVVSSYLNLLIMLYILLKKKYLTIYREMFSKLFLILLSASLMGIDLVLVCDKLSDFNKIPQLIITTSSGVVVYFAAILLFRVYGKQDLMSLLKKTNNKF